MHAVYNDFCSMCPPPGPPLWPALFLSNPVQWIAPDGKDLAAGESWSKYPRFWATLTSLHQVDGSVARLSCPPAWQPSPSQSQPTHIMLRSDPAGSTEHSRPTRRSLNSYYLSKTGTFCAPCSPCNYSLSRYQTPPG